MSHGYYEALAGHTDPARRVGWHDSLEQDFRHAFVTATLGSWTGTVLDLGCGEAALARWLTPRRYRGVELRPPAVARALAADPDLDVTCQDAWAALEPSQCCVAIGLQVGNERTTAELVARVAELGMEVGVVMCLKQEWLDARAVTDPALRGARDGELRRAAEATGRTWDLDGQTLRSDWVLRLGPHALAPLPSASQVLSEVIDGRSVPPGSLARLAYLASDRTLLERLVKEHPQDPWVAITWERAQGDLP